MAFNGAGSAVGCSFFTTNCFELKKIIQNWNLRIGFFWSPIHSWLFIFHNKLLCPQCGFEALMGLKIKRTDVSCSMIFLPQKLSLMASPPYMSVPKTAKTSVHQIICNSLSSSKSKQYDMRCYLRCHRI